MSNLAPELIGPMPQTDEWFAARSNVDDPKFGASQAAAILGVGEYDTARGIYDSFVNPDPEHTSTPAMRRGQIYERAIQVDYAETENQAIVVDLPMIFHGSAPLFATLDAQKFTVPTGLVLYWDKLAEREWQYLSQPVETKFSMSPKVAQQLGEEGSDWIPPDWYCQVQQQMDIVDEDEADVVVLLFGKLKQYHVRKNQRVVDAIVDRAELLRNQILHRRPPPLDFDHSTTKSLVDKLSLGIDGGEIMATEAMVAVIEKCRDLAVKRLADKHVEDRFKSILKAFMVDHDVDSLVCPNGQRVTLSMINVAAKTVAGYSFSKLNIPKRKDS